ncbi:diacylglycerol kinase family protein [Oceanihabitans sp. 2_MG-2023]|uniref:diacylglycerol kinase n=1 Tax=Oceanihabitans sp. 2_MG-2023 TaxID=3062661 RepID=UPI0026E38564|nr:diacylglycerol kinase family protein [Oceanihabitans sp. 2_MG-2023]MDO6597277.1 diacylglycerol kinase family protein [Oceanihabitans sp. 2_MG-2023]
MTKKESFLVNRLKSVKYAFKGAFLLITTENSIKVQFCIGTIMTILGFYYQLSATEWIIQIFCIALIMAFEGLNTAIEEIANFIHPEYHSKIGLIKDLAAGAVFIFAIAASIIGCIIYLPKIF